MKRPPLRIFFCYAHADRELRHALDAHLDLLEREGLVAPWFDGQIAPGTEWSAVIEQNLRSADVVVFLISRAFLESEYIADVEMRLALELHGRGAARLVPVLLEPVPEFSKLPIGSLEALPSKARPVSEWPDRVRALDDVVAGIRRAAVDVLIEGGGAFEFGSHDFDEAELSALDPVSRERALAGLGRLRGALVDAVPARRLESNLLLATWCLRSFGSEPLLPESLFYMAQVVSAFDVVSLQKVDRRMDALRELIGILGPEWGYLISDISEGALGNNERFAILHYRPRVTFEHISGDVVLPERQLIEGAGQFARKPLLASFRTAARNSERAADFRFRVCSARSRYGTSPADVKRNTTAEAEALARFLARVSERDGESIIVNGNFGSADRNSDVTRAFKHEGFAVPPRTRHASFFIGEKYYQLFAFRFNDEAGGGAVRVRASGVIDPFAHVFRLADADVYAPLMAAQAEGSGAAEGGAVARPQMKRPYGTLWRTGQLSNHLPLWVELAFGGRTRGGRADDARHR